MAAGPAPSRSPRARLSDHGALASLVADTVERERALGACLPSAGWNPGRTAGGLTLDEALRRAFEPADAPDPFDPARVDEVLDWLTAPTAPGGLGRYLTSLHHVRPDLVTAFPAVPGADAAAYLAWVAAHATADGQPADLVRAALAAAAAAAPTRTAGRARSRPTPGVTVLGFLRGGLGIGESARLLTQALDAADVPHGTVTIDRHLVGPLRTAGASETSDDPGRYDTTIVCVNADLTPAVTAESAAILDRTYRIGMWYWEVEDFPVSQHGGFACVDEVWVATDFIRDAVAVHSPVPVVTVTPPCPRRARCRPRAGPSSGCPTAHSCCSRSTTSARSNARTRSASSRRSRVRCRTVPARCW
ncbi:hypothetical protein [Cellulomonas soli]